MLLKGSILKIKVLLKKDMMPKRFNLENKGFIKEGYDADLVVIDLNKEGIFDIDNFYTKAEYSPFDGLSYKGKATMTIVNGEVVMENDVLI